MASSRARSLGYGSLGGAPFDDDDNRAFGSSSHSSGGGGPSTSTLEEGNRKQQWPWLRIGIASIAVVATLGLLSASRLASYPGDASSSTANTLVDPSAAANREPNLAETSAAAAASGSGGDGAPEVSGTAAAAAEEAGGDAGGLSFTAANEYTRRGDVVGLGYPWLQVHTAVALQFFCCCSSHYDKMRCTYLSSTSTTAALVFSTKYLRV